MAIQTLLLNAKGFSKEEDGSRATVYAKMNAMSAKEEKKKEIS